MNSQETNPTPAQKQRKLNTVIRALERELGRLIDIQGPDTSLQDKQLIATTLRDWCLTAIDKYVRGQKEHGGQITDRPCLTELRLELIDAMWYLAAARKQLTPR